MKKTQLLAIAFVALLPFQSQATWNIRPQAGVGYTDNANFETTDKDADIFWWVRSSNTYKDEKSVWNLWINYRDYLRQNQNNVFTYRVGRTTESQTSALGIFEWDLALGGQQYINENPGTTEQSFNNIYLETSLTKTRKTSSSAEITYGPLYQLTSFPSLGGRVDHNLLFNANLEWQISSVHVLSPYADVGYVISNQSIYSKSFFEVGTDWRIQNSPSLKYIFHLLSRFSTYPNRLVTDTTAVSVHPGKVRTTSQAETERQTFYQIQASAVKLFGMNELRGYLALNQNSTLSGLEDYNEMQIGCALTVPVDLL